MAYTSKNIVSLTSHQHLLKRLSLTFGPESGGEFSSQKTVAVREIVDNATDEVMAGFGDRVRVQFFDDGSVAVQDSGRGIPVDKSRDASGREVSGIVKCLGIIQSGGKFGSGASYSAGLNGVGASSTIHCSKRADVTVFRGGKRYSVSFADGVPGFFDKWGKFTELSDYSRLRVSKDSRGVEERRLFPTGTCVRVWLRDEVFASDAPFDAAELTERLRWTAYLVPQLCAEVVDAEGHSQVFGADAGIVDAVRSVMPDDPLCEIVHVDAEGGYVERNVPVLHDDGKIVPTTVDRKVRVDVAFCYGGGFEQTVNSFVNTVRTGLGGVHETAFVRALLASLPFSSVCRRGEERPVESDVVEGLSAVVAASVVEPSFTSQSKERLSGRGVGEAIRSALTDVLSRWFRRHSDVAKTMALKVVSSARARRSAVAKREAARTVAKMSSAALPSKLVDCELAGSDDAELYICEGDSACSSMKGARDGRVHALLPIRGKIVNAHKESLKRVLANAEVADIVSALGAGAGQSFDISQMRYGRVFIAADADPDGGAISALIYTLFWHLFPDVIREGRLFKVETPLFVVSTRDGKFYAADEQERDEIVSRVGRCTVTRLKGLGEVNADTLAETALNPDTRTVTQITIPDMNSAQAMLDVTMGSSVPVRREWIESQMVVDDVLGE